MDPMFREAEPLILYFSDKSIPVKKHNLLNSIRPTVHRLELEEPRFGLPDTVIIKQEKSDDPFGFTNEIAAYERLQPL
ncbi:hypothetical protein N7456_001149 [Penicillium angulare]|uniref:Uncharacterized protein n=1 Tax=Penicillium angulare TaxID=116970 RepID=A0A9W9GDH0_9EURO|nr:hypothetical protein N7456_001149 [Penicillium angulare]